MAVFCRQVYRHTAQFLLAIVGIQNDTQGAKVNRDSQKYMKSFREQLQYFVVKVNDLLEYLLPIYGQSSHYSQALTEF